MKIQFFVDVTSCQPVNSDAEKKYISFGTQVTSDRQDMNFQKINPREILLPHLNSWIWPSRKNLIYEGRTESHEQQFSHANWEQQTKDNAVVDGTSCCVILECLLTSIACITWLASLLTKWPTTICLFASVLSSNSLWKRKSCCRNSPETSACLWKCVHGCEQCWKMGETF